MFRKRTKRLRGKRRILDQQRFENLCRAQCTLENILGYVGTTEEELSAWCGRVYGLPLPDIMRWISQDGQIDVRNAMFDQLKSPSILSAIFNRVIPQQEQAEEEQNQGLQQLVSAIMGVQPGVIREVFADEETDHAADVP